MAQRRRLASQALSYMPMKKILYIGLLSLLMFSRALCYDDLQGALPQNQMPSDEPLQTEEFAVAAEKSTIDLYENYAGNSPDKRHRTQEASHRTVIKGWAGGD